MKGEPAGTRQLSAFVTIYLTPICPFLPFTETTLRGMSSFKPDVQPVRRDDSWAPQWSRGKPATTKKRQQPVSRLDQIYCHVGYHLIAVCRANLCLETYLTVQMKPLQESHGS